MSEPLKDVVVEAARKALEELGRWPCYCALCEGKYLRGAGEDSPRECLVRQLRVAFLQYDHPVAYVAALAAVEKYARGEMTKDELVRDLSALPSEVVYELVEEDVYEAVFRIQKMLTKSRRSSSAYAVRREDVVMAWRFVKQPNGLLAYFSSIVGNFGGMNIQPDEAREVALALGCDAETADAKVRRALVDELPFAENGECGDGLARWEDALRTIALVHGLTVMRERVAEAERGSS